MPKSDTSGHARRRARWAPALVGLLAGDSVRAVAGSAVGVLADMMCDPGIADGARVAAARALLGATLSFAELVSLSARVSALEVAVGRVEGQA